MTENKANFKFNVTGKKRKELVSLIANYVGTTAKYQGAPSFAYEVDCFTIDKNGTLIFEDRADSEVIERLIEMLCDNGFVAEKSEDEQIVSESQEDSLGLFIDIPHEKVDENNLARIMEAKGDLIKEALGINEVVIPMNGESVSFRWVENVEPNDVKAYTEFVTSLCAFTQKQKRINAVKTKTENKKYTFRCFLLRLGFIGNEYKETRKILLRNLEGSAAFKSGKKKEVTDNG